MNIAVIFKYTEVAGKTIFQTVTAMSVSNKAFIIVAFNVLLAIGIIKKVYFSSVSKYKLKKNNQYY